jgi:hypothetical protein
LANTKRNANSDPSAGVNPIVESKFVHWQITMSDDHLHILNLSGYFCEGLGIALVLFFPLRHLLLKGELRRAVLQMWAYFFLWSIALCFIFPVAAASVFHDKRAYGCFPEMIGIVPVALLGWLPSLLLCGLVWLAKTGFKRSHS